ncbi:MAG: hypothetical protein ACO1QB_04720 [Verrucomicrobiales bacterium]
MSSNDYDSPWKEALHRYLQAFMDICFPDAARAIDWAKPVEFLDKEFQRIQVDSVQGRQFVDKLAKVSLLSGQPMVVFLHIEVQQQKDEEFKERMFNYFIRLSAHLGHKVASFAIFADENVGWHPTTFQTNLLGCRCQFDFPTCKLLNLLQNGEKLREMERSSSAAAMFILANRAAQLTARNPEERYRLRLELTLRIYEKGLSKEEARSQHRFITWLMALPPPLTVKINDFIKKFEEEKHMPYLMEIEQAAIEKGRQAGMQEGKWIGELIALRRNVLRALSGRFGELTPQIIGKVDAVNSFQRLEKALDLAYTCPDLANFERFLSEA